MATREVTVAQHLATSLPSLGVSHVFELVGGMVTVILDSLHANPSIRVVSMHHEQAAGFAAEGFARSSGRPAVALATSGPGATNLLTAVGSCYFDSVPVVFITGQVNRDELRHSGVGRQGGFQETDIVAMATPITKHAELIRDPERFPEALKSAFYIATSGRPGPVLLDIPMDVQRSILSVSATTTHEHAVAVDSPARAGARRASFVREMSEALEISRRPILLAGGGLRAAGAVGAFREGLASWGIPVVTSLLGIDAVPSDAPSRVGLIGSYGNRWANWAVAESDLLVVLGSRLDVRQTGSDVEGFVAARRIFHVDVDETELNNRVRGCTALCDDLRDFVPHLVRELAVASGQYASWSAEIERQKAMWPDTDENRPASGLNPNLAVRQLCAEWGDLVTVVTDVGQHQMWAAQSIQLNEGQRFLTSGGMGSMGFGLPAAVGAAMAEGGRPVCLIAGDGGFQCNIQELQTAVRHQLPLRIVIFDNRSHGMVRQFQQSYFDSRYHSTRWGYSAPEFCQIATAYGVKSWHVETHQEFEDALVSARAFEGGPVLIHAQIDEELNAYPKMAFGQPFGSMEPAVAPLEMEGT